MTSKYDERIVTKDVIITVFDDEIIVSPIKQEIQANKKKNYMIYIYAIIIGSFFIAAMYFIINYSI